MLRSAVRAAQQVGAALVIEHCLREPWRSAAPAEFGGHVGDDADLRIQDAIRPSGRRARVTGMHDVGIQQRYGAWTSAKQRSAVIEFLDARLDQAEGIGLVRVPPVPVRDEPRAQQIDAVDRCVLPVPSNFGCHSFMPT